MELALSEEVCWLLASEREVKEVFDVLMLCDDL